MRKSMTFQDLLTKHDYYCTGSNFYSNEPRMIYETFAEFYEDFGEMDVDRNLVFRWDIETNQEDNCNDKRYFMEIFIMQQRKGIFKPILIESVSEDDTDLIVKYLKTHFDKIKSIWEPFQ